MWSLGIDIAKQKHNASLLDDDGKVVFRNFSFPNSQQGLDALLERLDATGLAPAAIHVGMEATGHYWILLYQRLVEAGYNVSVINPLITAAQRNTFIRGTKTDSVDSLLIASVLRDQNLKVSAIPQENVLALRRLARLRFESAQTAIAQKQRLLGLLDLVFPEYRQFFSDLFGAASRELLAQFPTAADLAKVDLRKLTNIIKKASRGRFGKEKARQLKDAAKNSFGLTQNTDVFGVEVRLTVERLNILIDQIAELDEKMGAILQPEQSLLRSIPGIGQVWAPTILAEALPIFHPELKNGADKIVAAAGLDARLRESGQFHGKSKMSKRGSKYLRTALMQAAEIAVNTCKDPLLKAVYDRQRQRGKHHTVALSHVARKMALIVFSVLKHKRPYVPILHQQQTQKELALSA